MGYYNFDDLMYEEYGDRACVHCGATDMQHEFQDEIFDHPFIANNLELLEWKAEQWEKNHPGMVLA